MSTAKFLAVPFGDLRRRLDQSLIYDWAMRCPIIVYCCFILFRDVHAFYLQVLQEPVLFAQFDGGVIVAMLARISQWMFVVLLSIQPLFRLRAIGKSADLLPRLAALAAVGVPLMFLLLERAPASLPYNVTAVIVSLFANVMLLVTVSFLGRSLSVMPEARRLVEDGPYGMVRHPLYLFEMLAIIAVALQYRSLPAAALLALAIVLQVARARWEEGVLARAFPDFAAYRARTSFIIPSDPVRFLASFMIDPSVRRRSALVVACMVAVLGLAAAALPRLIV
ncbi:MAG TPA: methyltransferase [Xanthobacteraceae bacterium]|nr:methyltransferase [Xanthobacteraceae bacterium]